MDSMIHAIDNSVRTLGYTLNFEDTSVQSLENNIDIIKHALKKHGVVCISNAFLDEPSLIKIGTALGNELVVLPKELSFNNKDERYPEIARIGNILIDGSLKDSTKEAIVWH